LPNSTGRHPAASNSPETDLQCIPFQQRKI